jgi:hypothetical protein
MTKRRLNQTIAVEAEFADPDGRFTHHPMRVLQPMLLPGGVNAEHNRQVVLDAMRRDYPERKWCAHIIYRWRSDRHLGRWLERGGSFRRSAL